MASTSGLKGELDNTITRGAFSGVGWSTVRLWPVSLSRQLLHGVLGRDGVGVIGAEDQYGGGVRGWAGKYTGKHGNCKTNEFQSSVWLRVVYMGASSGETNTYWLPYECVKWTDGHDWDVHFTTPGGKPGVGPSATNRLAGGS